MKPFVLLRGESGLLYVYERELWEYMKDMKDMKYMKTYHSTLEFVTDHDDIEALRQMQALVNNDLKVEE